MSQRSEKVENDVSASAANKLLVICIDRDNDVGEKAGIVTPVVGRDACIEAAQRLALEDPEDADSNSIFAAIKTAILSFGIRIIFSKLILQCPQIRFLYLQLKFLFY